MLNRIHHVGIAVRSADTALGFYRDLLGLAVTKDAVLDEQGIRGILLAAGETEIELLEPLRPGTPVGRFLDGHGEGLHHVCFNTDDIDAELEDARRRGLPLIDERPRQGLAGLIAFVHPKATHGVLVEYAQPPEPAPANHAVSLGKLTVRGFDHLAVAVNDIDAGARAWSQNFGLIEDSRLERTELGIRVASFPIGASFIGVISPISDADAVAKFIERRGEGLYLLSLSVANLDRALLALREHALGFVDRVHDGPGARFALVLPSSSSGVLLQLIERQVGVYTPEEGTA